MHPQSLPAQVHAHCADLTAQADARRASMSLRTPRAGRRLRRRTGWWLVGVGMKLAVDPRPARLGSVPDPA